MDTGICMAECLCYPLETITTLLINDVLCCGFSHVQLCVTQWTAAHQAPLFTGFSRQEYWSGLPCPPPGDLPNPGIKPASLKSPALAGRFFTTSATPGQGSKPGPLHWEHHWTTWEVPRFCFLIWVLVSWVCAVMEIY